MLVITVQERVRYLHVHVCVYRRCRSWCIQCNLHQTLHVSWGVRGRNQPRGKSVLVVSFLEIQQTNILRRRLQHKTLQLAQMAQLPDVSAKLERYVCTV